MKLLLDEAGAMEARRVWREAPGRASSVALLAEGRAALAAARRRGRINDSGYAEALATVERLWNEIEGVVLTESLASRAGELAELCALRGYDAVHLASAEAVGHAETVLVTADRDVASAAASLGMLAVVPAAA